MKEGVECLDSWYWYTGFLGQLDWRAEVCLDFHRSPSAEILVHCAVLFGSDKHLLHDLFTETRLETAALRTSKHYEFIYDSVDERADADLFQKVGMGWCFESDTGGMESNGSAIMLVSRRS